MRVVYFFCLAIGLSFLFTAAIASPSVADGRVVISQEEAIPAGFENLSSVSSTFIDVYYGNLFVGSFEASYSVSFVEFKNPALILSELSGIKDKATVQQALSGRLPTNSDKICDSQYNTARCGAIYPSVAGIIFNPNDFRANLFISPNFLEKPSKQAGSLLLPESDAGFSYSNTLQGVTSGSNAASSNSYNFYTQNIFAYREARLYSNLFYTQGNGVTPQLQFQDLNAAWYRGQYQVQGGLLRQPGNLFISDQSVLGASVNTTLDTVVDGGNLYANPIEIFLANPSQVSVYSEGRLIFSNNYPAGIQLIDTSGFPSGAYPIEIQIRDNNGVVTQQSQFFAKTEQIPPLDFPLYSITAGVFGSTSANLGNLFPTIYSVPFYQLSTSHRLSSNWGVNGALLGTDQNGYLMAGIFLLNSVIQLNPQFLVGAQGEAGAALNLLLTLGKVNLNIYARQIWDSTYNPDTTITDPSYFDPLQGDSQQYSANLSIPIYRVNLQLRGSYTYNSNNTQYNYGPVINVPLLQKSMVYMAMNVSLNKSDQDMQLLGQLNVSLTPSARWQHNGNIGYTYNDTRNTSANLPNNQVDTSWTSQWQSLDEAQQGSSVGLNVGNQAQRYFSGLNGNYTGSLGGIQGSVLQNLGGNLPGSLVYSASFNTGFVYTREHHAAENSEMEGGIVNVGGLGQSDAGIVVEVKSRNDADEFNVFVNHQVRAVIHANQRVTIHLEPFESYDVSIEATSTQALYDYKQTPEHITLYEGNYIYLIWQTHEKYIILAKILSPEGKPVINSIVRGALGFAATDAEGYLQAEITGTTKILETVLPNDQVCQIQVPSLPASFMYNELGELTCQPRS